MLASVRVLPRPREPQAQIPFDEKPCTLELRLTYLLPVCKSKNCRELTRLTALQIRSEPGNPMTKGEAVGRIVKIPEAAGEIGAIVVPQAAISRHRLST